MKCNGKRANPKDNTPYDDVGKTMLHGCPKLIIPVVNVIFEENYSVDDEVELFSEGHFLQESTETINKGYKDSYFTIRGDTTGTYHIELQSYTDNTIVLRIFEYDIGEAIQNSEFEDGKLIISIIKSAVIYLRHNKNTPDVLTVEIRTPGGNVSYEIPVLKTQKYTLDEIIEKKLWFLLPYYLFCREKDFDNIEESKEKLQQLKEEYMRIRKELDFLCSSRQITLYDKQTIVSMIKKVAGSLAAKHKKINEGVRECMGGKVLMHEAEALTQNGIRKGIALEQKNTERERKRAEEANMRAEAANTRAEAYAKEIAFLKGILKENGIVPSYS